MKIVVLSQYSQNQVLGTTSGQSIKPHHMIYFLCLDQGFYQGIQEWVQKFCILMNSQSFDSLLLHETGKITHNFLTYNFLLVISSIFLLYFGHYITCTLSDDKDVMH